MPMRMTWKGPWPIRRRPDPVPVVIVPADPRDEELRRLRAEVAMLRRLLQHRDITL